MNKTRPFFTRGHFDFIDVHIHSVVSGRDEGKYSKESSRKERKGKDEDSCMR